MAILYKGYAQQKGFAAWKVDIPDPSKRIREQGLEQMRGMEEQLEWNQNQYVDWVLCYVKQTTLKLDWGKVHLKGDGADDTNAKHDNNHNLIIEIQKLIDQNTALSKTNRLSITMEE